MKHCATILMSLFLFGACSARTMSQEPRRDRNYGMQDSANSQEVDEPRQRNDNSQNTQDYRQENNQNQRTEKTIPDLDSIKDAAGEVFKKLTGQDDSPIVYFENVPSFVDPLHVGDVVDKFALATVNYQHIQVQGLGTAYHGSVQVNVHSNKAVLKINLKSASISGQYSASDLINKSNGGFNIKLSGDVYYQQSVSYQVRNGHLHLEPSSGELHYGKVDSHYENIGFFAQLFQNSLGRVLLETVNNKVYDEIRPKVQHLIERYVSELYQQVTNVKSNEHLRGGIQVAVEKAQKVLSQNNLRNIELKSNNKEFVYHQLHAKISSVKLHGMEKFYLSGNDLTYNNDQFRAKVQLAVEQPSATAIISIHNDKEENSPFQKYNVNFNMDKIYAELGVGKRSNDNGLELNDIQTYVIQVQPVDTERYQGEMQSLVKHQLSSHIKNYIEDGLKEYIRNQIAALVSQGVVPAFEQQQQDARNQKY